MILDLVFVRHGVSCANAWSRKLYGTHILYPDPELTADGIKTSTVLSSVLIQKLTSHWNTMPFSIGASRMIRAQETAYYMLAGTLNLPINIIAHVGEAGITNDNYSLPVGSQQEIMKRNPDVVKLLLMGQDGREIQNLFDKANFGKFLKWAEGHCEYFALGSDGHYRAVIFTHSHFLKDAFHMPSVLSNNDAIHTVIDTTKMDLLPLYGTWLMNNLVLDDSCDGCKTGGFVRDLGIVSLAVAVLLPGFYMVFRPKKALTI